MLELNDPEVKFGLGAVQQAGHLVKAIQAEMVTPASTKEDRSPVTVADFAAQALVAHLLESTFPADPLVAEEDSSGLTAALPDSQAQVSPMLEQVTRFVGRFVPQVDSKSVCDWIDRGGAEPAGRFWTLDPIDGTKGFLRGDQYAVALALVIAGKVQLAVLGCPNLVPNRGASKDNGGWRLRTNMDGSGSLVLAVRGRGSWITSLTEPGVYQQLSVSRRSEPGKARLLRSFEAGHTNVDQIDDFARSLGIQVPPLRMDSQAKYAVLAAGDGDLLLRLLSPSKPDYREKIWDQAAGSLILQEAGGEITDLDGKPLDFSAGRTLANNRGILASNSLLHKSALNALRAIAA